MTPTDIDAILAENVALRERNQLLSALIVHSPALIFAKDLEGRITLCNRGFEEVNGRRPGEMIGMTEFEYMPAAAAEAVRANDRRVLETATSVEVEEVVPFADGARTYLSVKFPLHDLTGKISGVAGIATDITERARSEQERQALQQQIIDIQRAALSELSTPIIPLADGVIVMPLIGTVDVERAQQLLQVLLDGLASSRAHTAILDITGVRSVDAPVAEALMQAARAARLLGAKAIVTGIRAEVAQRLVALGVDWSGIETLSTLQAGVALALSRGTGRR